MIEISGFFVGSFAKIWAKLKLFGQVLEFSAFLAEEFAFAWGSFSLSEGHTHLWTMLTLSQNKLSGKDQFEYLHRWSLIFTLAKKILNTKI